MSGVALRVKLINCLDNQGVIYQVHANVTLIKFESDCNNWHYPYSFAFSITLVGGYRQPNVKL